MGSQAKARCTCGCSYPCTCDLLQTNLEDILLELGMSTQPWPFPETEHPGPSHPTHGHPAPPAHALDTQWPHFPWPSPWVAGLAGPGGEVGGMQVGEAGRAGDPDSGAEDKGKRQQNNKIASRLFRCRHSASKTLISDYPPMY